MKRGFWMLLPLLAACVAPGPRAGNCAGDFTVTNLSGREIEQVYAAGTRDLLDPGSMPNGTVRAFRAPEPSAATLRFVFTDGRSAEIGPVDLCALPRVVATSNGLQAGPL